MKPTPSTITEEMAPAAAMPAALNPTCLEMYLADSEFEEVFGMTKDAFYALRQWKQRELKKKHGLF